MDPETHIDDHCPHCGGSREAHVNLKTGACVMSVPRRCEDRDRCEKEIMVGFEFVADKTGTPASVNWNMVGDGTPIGAWLETRREGEDGTNICMCRIMSIGDEPEWIEKDGGRTTVTHHSFAAPTHWRWPRNQNG